MADAEKNAKLSDGKAFYDANGEFVELYEPNIASPTTNDWINAINDNIKKIAKGMNSWGHVLKRVIANTNEIYPQIDATFTDNEIHIRASKNLLTSTSLIFVLPTETLGIENGNAKLVLHHGGTSTSVAMVKEDYNGNLVPLEHGDIVSNRLAVFRTAPYDNEKVILVNAMSFGDINVRSITASHATFYNNPDVIMNGARQKILSCAEESNLIDELDNRYQKKIIVSTEPITNYTGSLEDGQLYIQVPDTSNN